MKPRWLACGLGLGVFLAVGAAGSVSPVHADFDQNDIGCTGTGVWEDAGIVIDAASSGDDYIVVPRSDAVNWSGSVDSPPGEYSGAIWLDMPAPMSDIEVEPWSGDSDSTSNAGVEEYDLPGWLPGGLQFTVRGEHTDENGACSGSVNLEIDGGPLSSPITWAALIGTAATAAGLGLLAKPMFRRVA